MRRDIYLESKNSSSNWVWADYCWGAALPRTPFFRLLRSDAREIRPTTSLVTYFTEASLESEVHPELT